VNSFDDLNITTDKNGNVQIVVSDDQTITFDNLTHPSTLTAEDFGFPEVPVIVTPDIPADALLIEDGQTTTLLDPGTGNTVFAAEGVTQTVASGDNINLDSSSNDQVTIVNSGTLINNDTTDEDVVIFVDNSEDDVNITNTEDGVLQGVNGVIFFEGDAATLSNAGLIEGTGNATEGVVYFDRDADGLTNTILNTGTITSVGGATIGVDTLLGSASSAGAAVGQSGITSFTLENFGTIENIDDATGFDDSDSDAINFNGDPGNTGGLNRGVLEDTGTVDVNGDPVLQVNSQVLVDIDNSGTISAARDNNTNAAIRSEDDAVLLGEITNTASGDITGANTGILIDGAHADHDLLIENAGVIEGTSNDGVFIGGAGVTLNNLDTGVIEGGDVGLTVASTVTNVDTGDVTVPDVGVSAIDNVFFNAGTISGGDASVDLSLAGPLGTLVFVPDEDGGMVVDIAQSLAATGTGVTFEQQGGALTGDFIGSTFTDTLNFTAPDGGTSEFTLTDDILSDVNVDVASEVDVIVQGARTIEGALVSDGELSFNLGEDSLAVTGDTTLNAGSVIDVTVADGVATMAGETFELITSTGTLLVNDVTVNITDNDAALDFIVVDNMDGTVTIEAVDAATTAAATGDVIDTDNVTFGDNGELFIPAQDTVSLDGFAQDGFTADEGVVTDTAGESDLVVSPDSTPEDLLIDAFADFAIL